MADNTLSPTPGVARAAGTVMVAFLISQLTGLAAKIIIGHNFNSYEVDAFLAANRPSEALVFIMTGGIFVSSFIPVFIKYLVKKEFTAAWKLASATANLIFIIMTCVGGLLVLFASPIVDYALAAWFSPEKQELTVDLLRIQAISIIFFSLSGLLIGILNSHQKFLLSALAPAMYQVGQIIGALVLAPHLGIYGLAWGVVIGSVLNLLIQLPGLFRINGRFFLTLGLRNPSVGEVISLMGPRMFGAAVVQVMMWINTLLASRNEGAVYALSYGFSLMMVAQIAIAQSVATAVMPTFSAQFAKGRLDQIRTTLASVIRAELLLSMPATAGLVILSVPIVSMLYQRGEFTVETTRMVAWALVWYSVGLVFHAIYEVLVRAYYAMHDTRTPVIVGAFAMTLSIGLSLLFSSLFASVGWLPHGGLALAVSLSTSLEVLILFLIIRRRLEGIDGVEIGKALGFSTIGTLAMAFALLLWMQVSTGFSNTLVALGGVALGLVTYAVGLLVLRVPELHALLIKIRSRLLR